MINGNGFIPNDGLNGAAAPWGAPNPIMGGVFPAGSPGNLGYGPIGADAVRPAWFGGSTLPGGAPNPYGLSGISGILAQLASQVQQSIAKLGSALMGAPSASSGSSAPSAAKATFQNVALASTGDPHLGVNGTQVNADGTTSSVSSNFDSMLSHADLFSTRDFRDGFHVSTTVTQPAANGVTQNASATATMDGGRESVTLTNAGTIDVSDHGRAVALAPGQTMTLSGGQQVTESANGSVSIGESAFGENLTTTFAVNGSGGVDVTASGQNVTLGGDLIAGSSAAVARHTM